MQKDSYTSSRVCYIFEAAFEYFISILISGAYLAKLTSYLGFSDGLTAILSSFVALGCSFQLLTLFFFRGGRVKRRVTLLHILNQLFFMMIYLVPFVPGGMGFRAGLLIFFLMGGYFISNIINSPKIIWYMSMVEDGKRGIFTCIKEMISLIGGMIFNLAMGAMIDHFEAIGQIRTSFILAAVTIFVLTVAHTLTLILAKEKEPIEQPKQNSVVQRFRNVITDSVIMKVIATSVFWTISNHMVVSFFGTYQVKELGFSMKFVAFLSILYAVARIPASFVLARYADRHSFAKMLKFAYGLAALGFLVAAFTVPANGTLFFPLYHILNAAAMGGINSAETNLILDYAPPEKRSDALAVKQTIYGLCGFLSTLAITPLFEYIQRNGGIFGIPLYAQQALSVLALICTLLLILYLDKVVLKMKKEEN
ncbi:MAG: MFS transporter [Ruminococcaceae bacterium]|nr:MFS transporter [Oscillospiraceae bacterium]